MRKRRSLTTALCALGLGISVTACGVLGGGDSGKDAGAAKPTTSATGGAVEEAKGGTALGGTIQAVRQKAGDQTTYRTSTAMEYDGELASTVESQVRLSDLSQRSVTVTYPAAFAAMGVTVTAKRISESLLLPDVIYMKEDPASPMFNREKPWSKMTRTDATTAPPGQGAAEKRVSKPLSGLDKLIESGEIRVAGQEIVAGVQTTHYAGSVSVMSLLEDSTLTAEQREQSRGIYELLGMDRMTFDLWVGPDGLPVKQITVAALKLSKPVVQKTTTTFGDWGQPVDLTPPPADQVEDLDAPLPWPTNLPSAPGKAQPSPTGTGFPAAFPKPSATEPTVRASTLPVAP